MIMGELKYLKEYIRTNMLHLLSKKEYIALEVYKIWATQNNTDVHLTYGNKDVNTISGLMMEICFDIAERFLQESNKRK